MAVVETLVSSCIQLAISTMRVPVQLLLDSSLTRMSVVIFGGTVLDIQAHPTADDMQRGSSVPGRVVQLAGGVGRNIAEATHHLLQGYRQQQAPVLLVSVVGQDAAADAVLASFARIGLSTQALIRSATAPTPCVVALLDRAGEVAASVADVAAPAVELTPAVVQQHRSDIAAAQLLVLDANLQANTLAAAAEVAAAAGVPVLFEPVSVPKAPRCVPILHSLAAISPNANELWAIADAVQQQQGLPPLPRPRPGSQQCDHSSASPQLVLAQLAPAAAVVLQQGLACIVLTMGSMGAALLTLSSHSRATHSQPTHTSQQQQQQPLPQHSSDGLSTRARALLLPQKAGSSSSSGGGGGSQSHKQAGRPGRLSVTARHIPAAPASVVNLSGAGDTLTGGLVAALVRGADPPHALAIGVAAARTSVQCKLNVPGPDQGLVFEPVQQAALQLLKQQAVWEFPVHAAL